jgi:cysteine dioxygenase
MSSNYLPKSLRYLIQHLQSHKKFSKKQVVECLEKVSYQDLSSFVVFSEENYTRNLLYKTSLYEIILLCWQKGQVSSVHDHNGSFGIVKVFEGIIEEKQFDFSNLNLSSSFLLSKGETSQISDHIGCHSLGCKEKAITLHVYSPPIEECSSYCSKEDKWKINSLNFNTTVSINDDFSYNLKRV